MVILRRTNRLRNVLPDSSPSPGASDNALGDWYVNRLVVDRQPLLLMISERSLLPIVLPARDVRTLPSRLAGIVEQRLRRIEIPYQLIEREIAAMHPVPVAGTIDRSVLGVLVHFGKDLPFIVDRTGLDARGLILLEESLEETPCHASGPDRDVIFPIDRAPELLLARWNG